MALPVLAWVAIGLGVFVLLSGIAFVTWFFFIRSKKMFPFLVYGADGRVTEVKGVVKVDPENKTSKKFYIEGTDQQLPIRPPTFTLNGVAYREVTFDQNGDLQYIEKTFDKSKGIEIGLMPEEKQIALARIKENEKRYENPMSKAQAWMMLSMFVLIFILILGIVYSTISYVKIVDKMVDISEDNKEMMKIQRQITDSNARVVEQLTGITAALVEGKNITRVLT